MILDNDKLKSDIRSAVSIMLKAEVASLVGFDEHAVAKIASQSENLAANLKNGWITHETRDFMMDGVRRQVMKLVGSLHLDAPTVSKLRYAVLYVVCRTISEATGAELKP